MSHEETALIELILDLPPYRRLMRRFGFRDRAELVAFLGIAAGTVIRLDETGNFSPPDDLDEMAVKVKDIVDMMRQAVEPPPFAPSGPNTN